MISVDKCMLNEIIHRNSFRCTNTEHENGFRCYASKL